MSNPVPAPAVPSRQAAILIVDDAPAQLGAMRSMMLQQGYQTFVANSGERALVIAQRAQPDLILLDIVLPGMDGMEVCRRLKAHPATSNIPVIFMSARTGTEDIVDAFDIGAADYIAKPLRLAEVCARVRAQLQFRRNSLSQQQQAERLRLIVDCMDEGLMVIEPTGASSTPTRPATATSATARASWPALRSTTCWRPRSRRNTSTCSAPACATHRPRTRAARAKC